VQYKSGEKKVTQSLHFGMGQILGNQLGLPHDEPPFFAYLIAFE
jgi:hypothetical protein